MALSSGDIIYNSDTATASTANKILRRDANASLFANVLYAEAFKSKGDAGGAAVLQSSTAYVLSMQSDGNLVLYDTNWTKALWNAGTSSSRRVKMNIQPINNKELDSFNKLRAVSFYYKPEMNYADSRKQYGLIAEEVINLYPNLVLIPNNYDEAKFNIKKGFEQPLLSVKYEQISPLLIKKVQAQQKEIDELEQLIKRQEVK